MLYKYVMNMQAKENDTVQVSFRLPRQLVERMRDITSSGVWPPPPSQTEIVSRGIDLVVRKLEAKRGRRRAAAE